LKILVTTDSNSLGAQIVIALAQETSHQIEVLNIDDGRNEKTDYSGYNIIEHQCELSDLLGLIKLGSGVDLIIHTAEFRSPSKKDKRLFEINHHGTTHIVDSCLANGVKQLLYVSHVSALGADRGRPLHEDDIWMDKPLKSTYGQSKYLGEQEVWRGQAEGLAVNIIAHSTIVSAIVGKVGRSKELTTAIVSSQDIVDMIKILVDRGLDDEKYICSAFNITHKDLYEALDHKKVAAYQSGWKNSLGSILGLFNSNSDQGLMLAECNIDYDNHKSINQLGFTYRSIEETIDS